MPADGYKYKSAIGERLARVLSELGYASDRQLGAVRVDRVCDVINRQSQGRPITPNMLRGYIYQGKIPPLDVAAQIAKSLRFNLNEIAYEERPMPTPKRQRVKGWLDEVDPLKYR
jgi:hypothetical protein